MNSGADSVSLFRAVQAALQQGRLAEAERLLRVLADRPADREPALQAMVTLYLQSSRVQLAADALKTLTDEWPDNATYYWELASLLQSAGKPDAAIRQYERLLARRPDFALGYFNLALLQKRALRYREALQSYRNAIDRGIDRVEEVYSNMGVLYAEMRNAGKATEMYERALDIDARYVPALYNLATLFEEAGNRQRAVETYRRILEIEPRHWDAIARLAQLATLTDPQDPLIERLESAVEQARDDPLAREGLLFALGRVLDGIGRYKEAYAAYASANALGRTRNPPYDREATTAGFDQLIQHFDAAWIEQSRTASTASPIFVCGMFRSGSTLIEQMLGAHPAVTAGGELDFLPGLIARDLAPYPQRVRSASPERLRALGDEYLAMTGELFPDAPNLTDKRPDNFLHLGLISTLFPRARIVYTRRNRLDNCLSVYFQQLGGNLGYATGLETAAHYHEQHLRLMEHWQACFGESIFTVDYDELVSAPEPLLRRLLAFLDLGWDSRCLAFEQSRGLVRTASLWQVREGLHTASSGRWRHYENVIPGLAALRGPDEQGPATPS